MANIHPEIKPNGVDDKYVIDLMYMLSYSLQLLCAKLDDDATVTGTNYEALCYKALMTVRIFDYRGNMTNGETIVDHIVNPGGGLSTVALIQWIWDWVNALETLTEKIDGDSFATSNYEDTAYEAIILPYQFENKKGSIIGQDNSAGTFAGTDHTDAPYYLTKIGPTAKPNDRVLCDLLYDMLFAWATLCAKLDTDSGTTPPTDDDYEALCYTATILLKVENAQTYVLGNDQTRLG